MLKIAKGFIIIIILFLLINCQSQSVQFDGNSAFEYLEKQCEFGPRNPGSVGYDQCKDYLISKLNEYADTVHTQPFSYTEMKTHNSYDLTNIIAQFNSEGSQHILLGAHWDTRPWADMDPTASNRSKPIIGANDGASGVAVLLELAKMLHEKSPTIKITIVLFDGEDLGIGGTPNSYARGSKYFAENLPITKPDYGIIIDMIGDKILEIPIERNSYRVAPELISELWELAEKMNLSAFQNKLGYDIFDDHIPLWEIAEIPSIDLIDLNYPNKQINYWHTMNDVPSNCSSESLEQVGQVLANYIYSPKR